MIVVIVLVGNLLMTFYVAMRATKWLHMDFMESFPTSGRTGPEIEDYLLGFCIGILWPLTLVFLLWKKLVTKMITIEESKVQDAPGSKESDTI